MGKKGKWFSALKKVFRSSKQSGKTSKQTAPSPVVDQEEPATSQQKKSKEARRWSFGKSVSQDSPVELTPKELHPPSERDLNRGRDPNKHALVVAAAEVPVAAAQIAAEAVLLGRTPHQPLYPRTREECASVKIQAAFRGYLARRAFRALRGVLRLRALVRGHTVRKQATLTLRCMQSLVRVQTRVRARRVRMSEDVQREIWQKRQEEYLARKSISDGSQQDWDDSVQPMEEIEAKKLNKYEAAIKRERALAYAFAHQLWRSAPKQASMYTDFEPDNPHHWGWSWIERWMAARPWEARMGDRESFSIKNIHLDASKQNGGAKPMTQSKAPRPAKASGQTIVKSPLGTPTAKSSAPNVRSASPRSALYADEVGSGISVASASLHSVGPRFSTRHSVAVSSIRDDESLTSTSVVPNYMNATQSAKAKKRSVSTPKHRPGTPEKDSISVKRKLSFSINEASVSTPKSSISSQKRSPNLEGRMIEDLVEGEDLKGGRM